MSGLRPDPSLNTPTRYGRRSKPGLSQANIVSVQAYKVCLHSRGWLERQAAHTRIVAVLPPNAVHPLSRAEWRAWLQQNHGQSSGIWLVSFKKATGKPRFDYEEAVEEALCFGWIDSKPNKLDEARSLLWFAPRRAKTGWSKPNKDRVERLLAAGLMQAAGLARIEQAKADGSWTSLDAIEQLQIPADLVAALLALPMAESNFLAFPRSAKRGILEWIHTAKRPETRATRIAETARLAQLNKRANQWPGKGAA